MAAKAAALMAKTAAVMTKTAAAMMTKTAAEAAAKAAAKAGTTAKAATATKAATAAKAGAKPWIHRVLASRILPRRVLALLVPRRHLARLELGNAQLLDFILEITHIHTSGHFFGCGYWHQVGFERCRNTIPYYGVESALVTHSAAHFWAYVPKIAAAKKA
jgi:hypothetical protein